MPSSRMSLKYLGERGPEVFLRWLVQYTHKSKQGLHKAAEAGDTGAAPPSPWRGWGTVKRAKTTVAGTLKLLPPLSQQGRHSKMPRRHPAIAAEIL